MWFGQVSRYSPFTVPNCETGAAIIWGLSVHWTQLKGHKYLFSGELSPDFDIEKNLATIQSGEEGVSH